MNSKLIGVIVFVLVIASITPFVSADLITPGYRGISIENSITNINDFPDYTFVSVCYLGNFAGVEVLKDEGVIEAYYKFCDVRVYAIKTTDFDGGKMILKEGAYNESLEQEYNKYLIEFFASDKAKLVVDGLSTYKQVPVSSSVEKIVNNYVTDSDTMKASLQSEKNERNNLIYIYIIVPIIALIVIGYIIYRRK